MGSPQKSNPTLNMPARLLDCRFLRINAEMGSRLDDMKGGTIQVNIDAGLNEKFDGADADKVLARINIDLTGIPQGADDKPESFAFKISLSVAGIFVWEDRKSRPDDLKESPVAAQLCQQLYPMALAEAKAIAQRLGFNNLELPWQLGASPKKAAAPQAKPQRAKRTTAKKKAA